MPLTAASAPNAIPCCSSVTNLRAQRILHTFFQSHIDAAKNKHQRQTHDTCRQYNDQNRHGRRQHIAKREIYFFVISIRQQSTHDRKRRA